MARSMEARAIVSAVDATGATFERIASKIRAIQSAGNAASGVGARFAAIGDKLDSAGRKVTAFGRGMTYGVTLPTALAARSAYHNVREFELASNKLKAFGDLSDEQLKRAREVAKTLGKDYAFGPTGVLKGMVEEVKAGFEPRHLEAIQKPLLDFATLAEIDVPQAAELAIFSLAGFGKMYDKTGKMLEDAALNKNLREMVDLFAILNKVAPGDIKAISETFKYSAATAKNLNISPEQLGAFTAVLAQSGIIGPEAGVALRSMLVRFIKTPRNALAALSAAGMRMDDYVVKDASLLKPDAIVSAVENAVGKAPPAQRAAMLSRLQKLDGLQGDDYEKGLIAALRTAGGDLADAEVAGKLATRIMGTAIKSIDINKFLKDVFSKAPNPAALMSLFMDQRQGNRLANLDSARVTHMLAEMEKELTDAREKGGSVSDRMARQINSGLIEKENRLRGAYQNFIQTLGESGAGEAAAKVMDAMASGLKALSETNPKILEFGTYATMATAAIGPLALVLGKFAGAAATIARILGIAAPAAGSLAGAAMAGGAGAVASAGALALPIYGGVMTGDWLWREALRVRQMREVGERLKSFGFSPDTSTLNGPLSGLDLRAAISSLPLKAEIEGKADVNVNVTVSTEPGFWSRVSLTVSNMINNVRVNAAPASGTAGSTGRSLPEAGPMP